MDKEQAFFIKHLRVDEEYSWRRVHEEYQKEFISKERWHIGSLLSMYGISPPHGRQQDGRELCRQAQELLNEDWEDECYE